MVWVQFGKGLIGMGGAKGNLGSGRGLAEGREGGNKKKGKKSGMSPRPLISLSVYHLVLVPFISPERFASIVFSSCFVSALTSTSVTATKHLQ